MTHAHDVSRDHHGNPHDKEAYLQRLLSPERDAWQLPDRVVRALGLAKGQTVAEIGAGPGYFTLRLAKAVGRKGSVLAVEVDPTLVTVLRDRLVAESVSGVTPVFGAGGDPFLPPQACDCILAVNVFHHIQELPAYLRRLKRSLRPGGHIVAIDFHQQELPVGPPPDHKLAREHLLATARRAGLKLVAEPTFLPYQYFLVLGIS